MNCVIIDDEPLSNEVIKHLLSNVEFIKLVGVFTSPIEASQYLGDNPVDLIILDINMPQLNGFQLLETLTYKPMVIVYTASSDFALNSFEIDAVDYLLKPVMVDKFLKAINKARRLQASLEKFNSNIEKNEAAFIRANGKFYRFKYDDIIMVEGQKDYVKVFTTTETLMVALNLTNFYANLPTAKFIRVHRSYIINLNKVTCVEKDDVFLGTYQAPIGSMYKDQFVQLFMNNNLIRRLA
ncbi:MAG: LytTR family DNA-binding domain-containing protein [Panacibacter sp.]